MIELDTVEIRQPLVPVVGVPLHHPDFVLDAANAAKWTRAGIRDQLSQIVVIILQCLLTNNYIPAASECRHHKADRAGLRQLKLDRMLVARVDLADRLEQDAARNADSSWWLGNTIIGGLHVLRCQISAVVKLHALPQMKNVGLAVRR